MNAAYFISKFEQFEQENAWDELFHDINFLTAEQEKHLGLSYDVSNSFENAEKNRYRNVLPYDQNRVTLKLGCQFKSDYINASPLNLPFAHRDYILTQGPLPNTSDDFWQMVYEQNAQIVIMLSKIMEKNFVKCHSYFPNKDKPIAMFECCQCELLSEDVKSHYIVRQILLKFSDATTKKLSNNDKSSSTTENTDSSLFADNTDSKVIYHFQYVNWPDFGVPEHTDHFLEFLAHVRSVNDKIIVNQASSLKADEKAASSTGFPVICHCSAGIGRTGAYVIIDSILSILEECQKTQHILTSSALPVKTVIDISGAIQQKEDVNEENHQNNGLNDLLKINTSPKLSETLPREDTATIHLQDLKSESPTPPVIVQQTLSIPPVKESSICKKKGQPLKLNIQSTTHIANHTLKSEAALSAILPLCDFKSDNVELMTLIDLVVFIRRSRMGLIQTPQQLRFCWKAIVDWINKNNVNNKM